MHCKGDHVPTRRPLLAVTGPPRQSGLSPVPWPLAGLQRPRPLLCTPRIGGDSVIWCAPVGKHLVRTRVKGSRPFERRFPASVHLQKTRSGGGVGSQQALTPVLLTPVDLRRCEACWEGQ